MSTSATTPSASPAPTPSPASPPPARPSTSTSSASPSAAPSSSPRSTHRPQQDLLLRRRRVQNQPLRLRPQQPLGVHPTHPHRRSQPELPAIDCPHLQPHQRQRQAAAGCTMAVPSPAGRHQAYLTCDSYCQNLLDRPQPHPGHLLLQGRPRRHQPPQRGLLRSRLRLLHQPRQQLPSLCPTSRRTTTPASPTTSTPTRS